MKFTPRVRVLSATSIVLLSKRLQAFTPTNGLFSIPRLLIQASPVTLDRSLQSVSDGKGDGSLEKAPTFDGKVVFPIKSITIGLKDHTVAAVYSVMNDEYKRG